MLSRKLEAVEGSQEAPPDSLLDPFLWPWLMHTTSGSMGCRSLTLLSGT